MTPSVFLTSCGKRSKTKFLFLKRKHAYFISNWLNYSFSRQICGNEPLVRILLKILHRLRCFKSQLAMPRMPYIGESKSSDLNGVKFFCNCFADPQL